MSEFQKVIKYLAIGFAAFIALSIITGIATGLMALTGVLSGGGSGNVIDVNKSFEDVKSISVNHSVGKLTIKLGNTDEVEVIAENVDDDFTAEKNFSGDLKIKSRFNFWNFLGGNNNFNNKSQITILIPEDFVAENIRIDAGAGNVTLDDIITKKLDINAGTGNIEGTNIIADKVKLDGGVGEIDFEQVKFTDVDIDSGVGNISLQGQLFGRNKIDCGIGEVDLNLLGSSDDYYIKVDKGLGNINIDGQKYSNINWNNMTADNTLDINGGVGNIDINFDEN
ncbi:MAG: putative rane protein [Anaerocolumna sp.]|jgi:DUF4097 and DUF4098 domain-containing protein YvlB|nr:putative rane protein [Anaerocolumna sp.]